MIYASLDVETNSRADALAIAAGIDGAAVLLSDDYPSLNPGFWVVYAGEWDDRRVAGAWCPADLDASLSCYPRYLGPNIAGLVAEGAALAQMGERLVALDPTSGEVLATFSRYFHAEAEYVSRFALNLPESEVYFGLTFVDSWYSCRSDKGEVRRLDLDSGTENTVADGWSPAVSPDGRWLALVAAGECYPDPETDGWVITPGSQVEVFDLFRDGSSPTYIMRPATPPTSYEDDNQVLAVFWDGSNDGLLVALSDDTIRSVPLAHGLVLDEAPVVYETSEPSLAAVSPDHFFFVAPSGAEALEITKVDRITGALDSRREVAGYWTGIAVNPDGEVLIGASGSLTLPSGEQIVIDGDIYNLAW